MLQEVWKSVGVPCSNVYGLEVIAWIDNELKKLEVE